MIALDVGDKIRGDAAAASVVDYTLHGAIGSAFAQLADGQLAATETDIYTAAAVAAISSIILVNTDTVARTVNLYLQPSTGTSRRLIPKSMTLEPGCSLHFDGSKISVLDTSGRILTDSVAAWLDQELKTTSSPTFAGLADSGLTASLPVWSDALKKLETKSNAAAAAIFGALLYPVGSIYISIVPTNPNTLFGFGTWAAFGAGKVLVGLDAGQTEFDVVEETGGEKTHVLTTGEMPSHNHTLNFVYTGPDAGATRLIIASGGKASADATAIGINNEGGGTAHNNLQPYVVVYMWKRTA